jgi:hypothetical protein
LEKNAHELARTTASVTASVTQAVQDSGAETVRAVHELRDDQRRSLADLHDQCRGTATAVEALRRDVLATREETDRSGGAASQIPDRVLEAIQMIARRLETLERAIAPADLEHVPLITSSPHSANNKTVESIAAHRAERHATMIVRLRRLQREEDEGRFFVENLQSSLRRHVAELFNTTFSGRLPPVPMAPGSPLSLQRSRGGGQPQRPPALAVVESPTRAFGPKSAALAAEAEAEQNALAVIMCLEEAGLAPYVDAFLAAGFEDTEALLAATDGDLVAMGIAAVGTRRTILTRLHARRHTGAVANDAWVTPRASSSQQQSSPQRPLPAEAPTTTGQPATVAALEPAATAPACASLPSLAPVELHQWVENHRSALRAEDRALERAWASATAGGPSSPYRAAAQRATRNGGGGGGGDAMAAWEVAWRGAAVNDLRAEGAWEREVKAAAERLAHGCHVGSGELPAPPSMERRTVLKRLVEGHAPPQPLHSSPSVASSGAAASPLSTTNTSAGNSAFFSERQSTQGNRVVSMAELSPAVRVLPLQRR